MPAQRSEEERALDAVGPAAPLLHGRLEEVDRPLVLAEPGVDVGEVIGLDVALAAAPDEYAFRLCGKRYILPADEVVVLAVDNITAENLAQALFERLWDELNRDRSVPWRERTIAACLRIDESLGQGASYRVQWEH